MQFPIYLLTSAIGGGILGAVHGAADGFLELRQRQQQRQQQQSLRETGEYVVPRIAYHGITGALLGPWFPVVVPLYYFVWKDRQCSFWLKAKK